MAPPPGTPATPTAVATPLAGDFYSTRVSRLRLPPIRVVNPPSDDPSPPTGHIGFRMRRRIAQAAVKDALPVDQRMDALATALIKRYPESWRWARNAMDPSDPALALAYRFLVDGRPTDRPVVHPHEHAQICQWLIDLDRHGRCAHQMAVMCRWCGSDWYTALRLTATTLVSLENLPHGPELAAEFAHHHQLRLQGDPSRIFATYLAADGEVRATETLASVTRNVRTLLDR